MKNTTKISLISMLSAIALIGTGYAAWTFAGKATTTAGMTANVTSKSEIDGKLTADPESFYLVVDQDYVGWGKTNKDDYAAAGDADALSNITLTYTFDMSVADEMKDYSGIVVSGGEFTASADITTYFDVASTPLTDTVLSDTGIISYTLPVFTWKADMKPTTSAEYDTMKAALSDETFSFNFTAKSTGE